MSITADELDEDVATAKLAELDVAWSLPGGARLERVFTTKDFASAL